MSFSGLDSSITVKLGMFMILLIFGLFPGAVSTIIASFIILASSVVLGWLMRRFNSNSRFAKVGVILAFMGIAAVLGVFDPWMAIIFGLIAIALAMASDTSLATR